VRLGRLQLGRRILQRVLERDRLLLHRRDLGAKAAPG
jgi:hypothetical protein